MEKSLEVGFSAATELTLALGNGCSGKVPMLSKRDHQVGWNRCFGSGNGLPNEAIPTAVSAAEGVADTGDFVQTVSAVSTNSLSRRLARRGCFGFGWSGHGETSEARLREAGVRVVGASALVAGRQRTNDKRAKGRSDAVRLLTRGTLRRV
jgi:hypothetical protein